jgi:lysophospholipase L1-like esterase
MSKMKTTRAFLSNLLLVLASVVIALLIAEYAARYYLRDITTTSSNSSYLATRWARESVRLNSWWFRDGEMRIEKPQGVYRIAIIGDSVTYGQGIREEDRFSNLLQGYLDGEKSACRFEVLNFGWLGSETIDEVNVFRNTVYKVNPDFIVLQWFINDVEGHDKSKRPQSKPLIPFDSANSYLYQNSVIYYLLDLQWQNLVQRTSHSEGYRGYLFERFGDPEGPEARAYVEVLREFIGLCRERGIPVGVILFPDMVPGLADSYPFEYLHDLVHGVCDQEGVPYVDLLDTYTQYKDCRQLWVNRFDHHPSPLANRLAAEKLLERFGETWREAGRKTNAPVSGKAE